jgi:hypothetical protein
MSKGNYSGTISDDMVCAGGGGKDACAVGAPYQLETTSYSILWWGWLAQGMAVGR